MTGDMLEMKTINLVILASPTGRDGWKPVPVAEVPAWVKHPDTIAKMVAGEMCMKADEGDKGSDWYRCERVLTDADRAALAAAEAKRARRAKRTIH